MKRAVDQCRRLFTLLIVGMFLGGCHVTAPTILVHGPGVRPHLEFACCEQGTKNMQRLFANPEVIPSLRDLHASVAIAIVDLSPQRAAVVRHLNEQGIPVVAWILLPREQGYYLTANSAPEAVDRFANFERWTSSYGLRWSAVGLDVEPNFGQLNQLRGHRWRLIAMLLRRSFNGSRIKSARKAYSRLIATIRSRGYPAQVYEMPYVAAERSVHSSLIDRWLGTVDLRGDENYLMLYTSYARAIGAGMIWSLGRDAQAIAIGSTEGDSAPGSGSGPLNWTEFSTDLIVASHFTRQVAVYDLEGCVRQGFLPHLRAMNWSQSVVIPAESVRRAEIIGFLSRSVLWIASNLLYFLFFGLMFILWALLRRRARRIKMARH